jgi:hypothetical protein
MDMSVPLGGYRYRVVRFLDEQTSVGDELRLIASLPPAPFLRASAAALAR